MSNARNPWLDFFRAIAITLVVACHGLNTVLDWPGAVPLASATGYLGVELFFVLSGFLVGGILLESVERDPVVERWMLAFWMRRWVRTLPSYYLFIGVNIIVALALTGLLPAFGHYLVLVQNLVTRPPEFFRESWSLTVEEMFYLIVPILLLVLIRGFGIRANRAFLGLAVGIIVVSALARWWATSTAGPGWDYRLDVKMVALYRLDSLIIGMLAYWLSRRTAIAGRGLYAALGFLILLPSTTSFLSYVVAAKPDPWQSVVLTPMTSIGAALILVGFNSPQRVPQSLKRPAQALARWAYALYLVNLPVLTILLAVFHQPGPQTPAPLRLLLIAAFVALSVGCAALVYRVFERPILRSRDRVVAALGLRDPQARGAEPAPVTAPPPAATLTTRPTT